MAQRAEQVVRHGRAIEGLVGTYAPGFCTHACALHVTDGPVLSLVPLVSCPGCMSHHVCARSTDFGGSLLTARIPRPAAAVEGLAGACAPGLCTHVCAGVMTGGSLLLLVPLVGSSIVWVAFNRVNHS